MTGLSIVRAVSVGPPFLFSRGEEKSSEERLILFIIKDLVFD
jgi:hypothetical protein